MRNILARAAPLLLLGVLCGSLLYAQNYQVRWSAVDLAGRTIASTNYKAIPSVARTAPGQMAGSAFQAFIGYWQIDAACPGIQEAQQGLVTEPLMFALSVSPNPMRLGTAIRYSVPVAANVSLKLYDITGALARTVSSGPAQPGRYTANLSAEGLARGVYILKLQSDAASLTRKVVIQ
jgi:hypothetical protein